VSDQARDRRDGMTVAEAVRVLGISEGAVRKRVERGKLKHGRIPDGRLIVYLDTTATNRHHVHSTTHDTTTERYVRSLEDQVEYLRQQLDQEREANRENWRIIAGLIQRIPEIDSAREISRKPSEFPTRSQGGPAGQHLPRRPGSFGWKPRAYASRKGRVGVGRPHHAKAAERLAGSVSLEFRLISNRGVLVSRFLAVCAVGGGRRPIRSIERAWDPFFGVRFLYGDEPKG
jgi:hypothetical protein